MVRIKLRLREKVVKIKQEKCLGQNIDIYIFREVVPNSLVNIMNSVISLFDLQISEFRRDDDFG